MKLYKVEIRDKKQGFYTFEYFTCGKKRSRCIRWALIISEIYGLNSFAIRITPIV